jgi:excisionase family DNA binding protein
MNMSGNLLNKNELREYIGVSKGTIDNWMKANKIQYIKVGNVVRFDKSVIDNDLRVYRSKK